MEPRKGFEFYQEAAKQRQDERLFLRWVHGYQMEMSFSDFKKAAGAAPPPRPGKTLTEEEIYAKVRNILRKE